jgi:hypothetical protein
MEVITVAWSATQNVVQLFIEAVVEVVRIFVLLPAFRARVLLDRSLGSRLRGQELYFSLSLVRRRMTNEEFSVFKHAFTEKVKLPSPKVSVLHLESLLVLLLR